MNNIEAVSRSLERAGLDAVMITGEIGRHYVTGFHSTAGALLVTRRGSYFMTDSRYIEAAGKLIDGAEVLLVDSEMPYSKRLNALLGELDVKSLGFEDEVMTYSEYLLWSEKLHAELVPAQSVLTELRAVKSRDELAHLVEVQRLAEKSFNTILPLVTQRLTEKQLAAELVCRFLKNGADDKSFDPIVVSGVRSSMPHGVPGDNVIEDGFLTIDFGARLHGWCSDTTRTLCVGQPTEEMVRVYDTVLAAQLAGIASARAGVTGAEVDAVARRVIEDAGYGAYFGHSFGHGLGLEVHEMPNASSSNKNPLPAGALISAEPGIYLPGKFGVRIEDVIYITEDGCENITALPKKMEILT